MDTAEEHFSFVDYSCFAAVLLFSALIGFYHGVTSRKRPDTREQYLLGGRKMGIFPVMCSLVATSISGMTIVGLSAEAYNYGIHPWLFSISLLLSNTVFLCVFIPVLTELKVASSFQYLEMRFSRSVRIFASGIYALSGIFYLPVTVYVPALVFQKVTGVNIYATIIALSLLCASYTAIGGFRAVVWTDVLQLSLLVVSTCIIATVGIKSVGGIENIWETADRGGRLNWINITNFNSRSNIIGYVSSIIINIYQFQLNQANVQRYLSLPNIQNVKLVSWIVCIVFGVFICLSQLIGITMYTSYETCDPVSGGMIEKVDQILPHFVQEKASLFIGFNGIFIAGIFAASLSTTSSYLNALGGTIYEDFFSYRLTNISEKRAQNIMKSIVILLGVLQVLMVFVIQRMGMIFAITNKMMSLTTSMLFGFFTTGMLFPNVNGKGAQAGACAGGIAIAILIVGGMNSKPEAPLPFRTDGCSEEVTDFTEFLNSTLANTIPTPILNEKSPDDTFWLFKIAFVYYGLIGLIINLTTSYIVSACTGGNIVENQKLLAPFMREKSTKDVEIVKQKENLLK